MQIDIRKLKRKINKNELQRQLSLFYRPLLLSGQLRIFSSGEVIPQSFSLDLPEDAFEFVLANGHKTKGWLGVLERGCKLRGGIRCYAFGRLITENEYFKQKDFRFKESLDRLIGEIYIESEDLPLTMNKSDFDRGSPLWHEIEAFMYAKMQPYIDLLLEEKDKDLPSEKEQKVVQYAGDVWSEFLRYLRHEQKQGSLPGLPIDFGQKPPELSENREKQINNHKQQEQKDVHYQPATPPPFEHIGKRRRTGAFPKPVLHPLPEVVRYQLAEENGVKVIKINTRFPAYKLRKNQLTLYIWETLILEYAKTEDSSIQSVDDYIEEMNSLLLNLAVFIRTKGIKIANI